MKAPTSRTRRIGLALGGAVLAAGLLAGTSLAQTPMPPRPGFGHGWGMMGAGYGFDQRMDGVAEALGMTTAELWQAHHVEGKSLGQIANERGLAKEAVAQAMLREHKEQLNTLVATGRLSQAQADAWLAAMEPHVRAMLDVGQAGFGPGMMGWRGSPGGMGGPRGPFGPGAGFGPRAMPTPAQ